MGTRAIVAVKLSENAYLVTRGHHDMNLENFKDDFLGKLKGHKEAIDFVSRGTVFEQDEYQRGDKDPYPIIKQSLEQVIILSEMDDYLYYHNGDEWLFKGYVGIGGKFIEPWKDMTAEDKYIDHEFVDEQLERIQKGR